MIDYLALCAPRPVLDSGFVRLVSCTQPIEHLVASSDWTGDLEAVRNARVSHDADWRTGDDAGKDAKLLQRMTTEHHSSPFEAMVFTFEIKAPIFVIRQWHRHRTWSYNEVSARYAELPSEYYVPNVEQIGRQSPTDKQQRVIHVLGSDEERRTSDDESFVDDLQMHSRRGFLLYKDHLSRGVPRELARCFLGLNAYTRMFATVDYHNLKHFLKLRLSSHAQYEIRVYAEAMSHIVEHIMPVSHAAFLEVNNGT